MKEIAVLLDTLLGDLHHPQFIWQVLTLLFCLTLGQLLSRYLRHKANKDDAAHLSQRGMRRLSFPLISLLLVWGARYLVSDTLPTHLLSIAIPLLFSLAVVRAVFFICRVTFSAAAWLAGFERIFAFLVWFVVALHILGLLPQVVVFLETIDFAVGKQQLNLWIILQGMVTVLVTLLFAFWLSDMLDARLSKAAGLDGNLRIVFTRLGRALFAIIAILVSLPLVGIDVTTLSVFGGALGVGLGFGLQKIASNYVAGFIILLERSIQIGDVITVAADRGQVTRMTTRYTVLRTASGIEHIVPNELLIGSVVHNESLTDLRTRLALPIQVAYDTDLTLAMKLLADAAAEQSRVLADPAPQGLVMAFADSGINLEIGFWISDPEVGTAKLRSDINLAIWRRFQEAGIQIPYPQREVRLLNAVDAA